jgi:hypothetical protein
MNEKLRINVVYLARSWRAFAMRAQINRTRYNLTKCSQRS